MKRTVCFHLKKGWKSRQNPDTFQSLHSALICCVRVRPLSTFVFYKNASEHNGKQYISAYEEGKQRAQVGEILSNDCWSIGNSESDDVPFSGIKRTVWSELYQKGFAAFDLSELFMSRKIKEVLQLWRVYGVRKSKSYSLRNNYFGAYKHFLTKNFENRYVRIVSYLQLFVLCFNCPSNCIRISCE